MIEVESVKKDKDSSFIYKLINKHPIILLILPLSILIMLLTLFCISLTLDDAEPININKVVSGIESGELKFDVTADKEEYNITGSKIRIVVLLENNCYNAVEGNNACILIDGEQPLTFNFKDSWRIKLKQVEERQMRKSFDGILK